MSRFDALKKAKRSAETEVSALAIPNTSGVGPLKRRGNEQYKQFSAYVPLPMYRKLKGHLGATGIELSEAVEQALADWIEKQGA
jgi:hypothetical protein